MNRSERIDEMLNLMNVDVGTIEDRPDWLQRMKILCRAATVLAFGDEEAIKNLDKLIGALKEIIDAKEGITPHRELTIIKGGEQHAEENS